MSDVLPFYQSPASGRLCKISYNKESELPLMKVLDSFLS